MTTAILPYKDNLTSKIFYITMTTPILPYKDGQRPNDVVLLDVVQTAGVGFEGGRVANHLVQRDHQEHQVQLEVRQRSEVIHNIQVIPLTLHSQIHK